MDVQHTNHSSVHQSNSVQLELFNFVKVNFFISWCQWQWYKLIHCICVLVVQFWYELTSSISCHVKTYKLTLLIVTEIWVVLQLQRNFNSPLSKHSSISASCKRSALNSSAGTCSLPVVFLALKFLTSLIFLNHK